MKIYKSTFRQEDGFFASIRKSLMEVFVHRWFILLLIKKQNKLMYQQDVLSLLWMIVMPLIPMTAYILLASIKVFNKVDEMPFVFYIVIGMFVWMLMSTIVTKVMLSIKKEKNILQTTRIPILVFMISKLGEVLFDSFIRFIAVVVLVLWFQIDVSLLSAALLFLCLIPIILISFAIGAISAILDMIVQDTRKVVDIFFRYGLFVSSVIFPFPTEGILGFINEFNVFNTYINSIRDLLYYGYISNLSTFIYSSVVGLILFVIALKTVYVFDYKIREYL